MDPHRRLGISRSEFEDVRDRLRAGGFEGREYRYLPDYDKTLEKGTVLVGDAVVRGFPKVPRTLVLETGLPRHFDGEFAAEEKMDGYNVRVARVDGDVLAFTRSGIACPFTTAKLRAWVDWDALFDDRPDLMVCGEVAGPENPYTVHAYDRVDSLAFFAFDARDRSSGDSLPVRERRELLTSYDVPQVPIHGFFDPDDAEGVRELVRELDAEGREGLVMKSPDVSRQLKYTTASANRGDLAFAFSLPFDYGRDFMFRRLIREAFQSWEFEETEAARRERAHAVGEALVESMTDTVARVADGEEIGEPHTVRGDPAVIDALFDHLDEMGLHLLVRDDRTEDGERVVAFEKRMRSTTDKTRAYLDGKIVTE
jgi:putative ATP-dependent DNA ligase